MSIERFLRQRAVDIVMEGTYVLRNWYDPEGKLRTFTCRATRVSPFRMMVEMPVVGKVGDNLISYFRDIGNFEGTISDTARSGVLLELEMTQPMRAKLADKLTWLEKKTKDPVSIIETRKTPRFVPKASQTTLTLADGTIHPCFVIDASQSGVAVMAELQPPIGTPLGIGACVGRVIRHTPDGFAVKFVKHQSRDELQGLIVSTPPTRDM
ncbi:PilZ domain-containing protein [Bradyrhizobium sp.]|uniref:PilZ domain-containing protein n=1 Tax=Bradyrhizobium sp. TaxID=376 RepID=UPI002BD3F575|nr:PilZ domain-containing protein [Bradyrhizobium sp.]HMM91786.1 PilZ domain-containing protein [Bradyrhizobium sp.]